MTLDIYIVYTHLPINSIPNFVYEIITFYVVETVHFYYDFSLVRFQRIVGE